MSTSELLALHIVRLLRTRGHKAFLVGGCVRDRLLGIPVEDFDVSTDASPDEMSQYFPGSQQVGAHFGVILVSGPGDAHVEVATFRTEGAYSDGRRPDRVHFETDPALDAARRDFTVNALMEDPVSGEVFDFVGGRADLSRRIVRAVGDPEVRFREDFLRMLRAVRFAARLGFTIEPQTFGAIRKNARSINRIAAERIREELSRILTQKGARRAFELLDECLLLQQILPEIKALQGVPQPPEFHPEGDVWKHELFMLERLCQPSLTLALGALFHDVGKPSTLTFSDRIRFNGHAEIGAAIVRKVMERLRFGNDETSQVVALVSQHMRFKDVQQMRMSTLKRFLRLPHFSEHLELHRLDCLSSNGYTQTYDFVREKLLEFGKEELRPARLITGDDLIQAGYKPGPPFRRALDEVENAQLDGQITTREQALAIAQSILDKAA
jgi:poly(A) polymerase